MSTEILVNAMPCETRVAMVEHGLVQELYIELPRRLGIVGNIYQGRVARVLPGMQAAFIDIGDERSAFLHVDDIAGLPCVEVRANGDDPPTIGALLSAGEAVLVQVLKDPLGTKGARVTTRISMPSRYMVYVPGGTGVGVSARIEDVAERERIRNLVELIRPEDGAGGYIVRTAGEGTERDALRADMLYLSRLWAVIEVAARVAPCPGLVHEDLPLPLRIMRDLLDEQVVQLRVDSPELCARMRHFATQFLPGFSERITRYEGERPIFDLYGVEDEIARALERRVNLKSGGYLIFDQTEAMTTVDVNTGAYIGRNANETFLKTNLEAAQAIARQLRLRNLGGIIIIDFIDLDRPEHRQLVLETLKRELAGDRAHCMVSEVTSLGLVQMTRKRNRESLGHVMMQPCPHCDGRGAVKTPESICFDLYRELIRLHSRYRATGYIVLASAPVIDLLLDEESTHLAELSSTLGRPVRLQVETQYRAGQFDVIPL